VIVKADEDSLVRMLGVEMDGIPTSVVAEYELRLRMFHSDGNSGPLGTVGIIDMLRSMKLGPPKAKPKEAVLDWAGVPHDGTVRVEAKRDDNGEAKWLAGIFLGQVRVGTLAVRLDGREWIDEFSRKNVRLEREKPAEAYVASEPEEEEDTFLLLGMAQLGDRVWIDEDGDWKAAEFGDFDGAMVSIRVHGERAFRSVPASIVACLAQPTATSEV